jgi:hypothetical protein
MAYNLYHRGLSKDAERLREVSGQLAPFGVALSDFKKFRIGYSPPSADLLSGYYAAHFARYPAVRERFERLGLIREGRDTLSGCATFPVLDERARPEGLIGAAPEGGATQQTPPGQPAEAWLFGLEKAACGVRDHALAIVAPGVLSFFSLYSILSAIGLEVAVGLAAPALEEAALRRLLALGAEEVFLLAAGGEGLEAACAAHEAALHRLAPVTGQEEALARLEEIAAVTRKVQVRWMLRQAVAACREWAAKVKREGEG